MNARETEGVLEACERGLASEGRLDLRALGFWRAVAAVKRDRSLVDAYADRIARIDRAAFDRAVPLRLPAAAGVVLLAGGLVIDLVLLAAAAFADPPWREILLLLGAAGLDIAVHGLAHLVVGAAVGIRFTEWFVDLPKRPQPGFKIDYASYLRTPARSRAWMHASGAIATKLAPFAAALYGLAVGADAWALWIILGVGALQIVTDLLYSMRASDWKKFRREMRLAR
jgi:hypothetical protein